MLSPGHILQNRYVIERKLGDGGFGTVYQALHKRLEKAVAIKETHFANNPDFVRRFEEEARLLAGLCHPALPAVTDYFEENNSYYLVMEYVPGETLEDYLKRQPNQRIDEHTALNLISPVLDALEYLDAQDPPIIHRDIKPTNIRRTPDKNVYLVDFGIAKSYNSSQHTTVAARAYTPGFSPIEQYMADMRTDRRSDIYALGATLYYILSGTFPEDVPNRMQGTPLTPLSEHNPSLSTELEAIIIKMLAIWPNERYQNMAELRQALGQRGLEQQYREREARKQLEQNYSGQGILELADHTFRVNNIAFNPDGNILVSASGNTVRLWRVTDGSLIRTLSGHTNDIKRVSFSPDGKILASASDDETVRLWRVADGALIHVLQENIGWCITNVVFSPDSSLLALGSNDGIVQVWQVADGTLLKIFQDIDDVGWCITSVALSPDGAFLASVVNKIIRLWRVTDGSLLYSLTGHRDNIVCVAFSPDGTMLASGSNDKTVRLWQVSGSSRIIQGHIEGITSVSFSPDGTILASGSWDKTIRLWRVAEGTQLRILTDYNAQGSDNNVLFRIFNKFSGWVTSVVFSPNGMLLASASENIVWLWNLRNSDQEWQLLKQSWKEKRESAGRCEECGRELDKKEKELGRTICKTCR